VEKKFTQASMQSALRRGPDGFMVPGRYRDHAVPGLSLVIGRRSARWVYSYRPHGISPQTIERWPTRDFGLGVPARMSLPEARAAALKAKSQVQHGEDPHRARMLQVEETVAGRAKERVTVASALERYRAATLNDPTPYKRTEVSQAVKAAADILALKGGSGLEKAAVEAIDLPALKRWARALPDRNAKAKLRWGAINRFLEWCVDEDLIDANPCALVPKARRPVSPNPRDNVADAAIAAAIWQAAENEPSPSLADLVRFLCLVPCRRQEAARIEFTDIDFDRREWRAPASKTKNSRPHTLPLPDTVMDILKRRHACAKEGLAFPGPNDGGVFCGWSRLLKRLRTATGRAEFGFHAVRRGFVTELSNCGFDPDLLDGMLNHSASETRSGVKGVYNLFERLRERRRAMDAWADLVVGHTQSAAQLADQRS
jgi:integrase